MTNFQAEQHDDTSLRRIFRYGAIIVVPLGLLGAWIITRPLMDDAHRVAYAIFLIGEPFLILQSFFGLALRFTVIKVGRSGGNGYILRGGAAMAFGGFALLIAIVLYGLALNLLAT